MKAYEVTSLEQVSEAQAFEWVKTGVWTKQQFVKWVNAKTSASWSEGYEEGRIEGYDVE